jgi:uncharacterized protein with FMN-binding domain
MPENQTIPTQPAGGPNKTPLILGGVLGIAVLAALVVWFAQNNQTDEAVDNSVNPGGTMEAVPSVTPTDTVNEGPKEYADGNYQATGNYLSPAGMEEVVVSLVLTDNVITAAEFEGQGTNPTTKLMQGKFAEGYSQVVVGKNIDEVELTVVNGSSLTPIGFTEALNKIKAEAEI